MSVNGGNTTGSSISGNIDDRGTLVEPIPVEIDFAIIEHFSKNLYGSPNKAIEELVSNGFDALARSVHVHIPGSFTDDQVLVWDDGESMGVADLHKLWWIAQSPKNDGTERIRVSEDRTLERAMIGKFGIGKLASYAVGRRLTHLCRKGERFLRVSVDYDRVPRIQELAPGEEPERLRTPVVELTEDEAHEYVSSLFKKTPTSFEKMWDADSWTLAVVDKIRDDIQLTEGRLGWVIGNGMPLRPDFKVWLNDKEVESKLARGARASWDVCEPMVQDSLAAQWEEARQDGRVDGDYFFVSASDHPDGHAVVVLPSLGEVRADVHLFEQSLRDQRSPDEPRSYGFFVMVRGRLLNPEDAKLSMSDPSYGTFYRCQYVIEADGLDEDLLADRERLHLDTRRTREFAVLRDALYLASRQALEDYDERAARARRSDTLLPVESRDLFREPIVALLMSRGEIPPGPLDTTTISRIERATLEGTDPIAMMNVEKGGFLVNLTHPLRRAVQQRLGGGRKAQEAMRVLDVLAVSERLFEGYLYDMGVPDEHVQRIVRWREGLLRSMALRYEDSPIEEIISEVREASYKGAKPFEDALARLFGRMGFEASRDGASGRKDILVVAPIGSDEYNFTVEAKGSINAVQNDDAEIGGANAHRRQIEPNGARLAVVVAREFAGFGQQRGDRPAILQECDATDGKVTIVTVEVLAELLVVARAYGYGLDDILPVLEVVESPDDKLRRVRDLRNPTDDFDYRGVLEEIWEEQQGRARGDIVPYRSLWQSRPDRWGFPDDPDQFLQRLRALEVLSGYLLQILDGEQAVVLRQNPEIVAECIQRAVESRDQFINETTSSLAGDGTSDETGAV